MATIDYAKKYSNIVSERFKEGSISERMVNQDYDFVGAKTVKVYNISTAPLNDYKRTGVSRYGEVEDLDATTEEMTMSQDKGFTFAIDKMDEDETNGALAAGTALARQLREVVIPTVDIYRYGVMAEKAGKKATSTLTKTNIYEEILKATEELDNNEVPFGNRFLLVTPGTLRIMKESKDIVLDTEIGQELRLRGVIGLLDGMEVIKVPASRLPEKFNFLVGHEIATTAPVKLAEYKINTEPQGISGSLVEGRVYYDAFVLKNKAKALYLNQSGAATK